MKLTLACTREADGRWLAEVSQLPGVLAYGISEAAAMATAQALALRVLAERIEEGTNAPGDISLSIIGTPPWVGGGRPRTSVPSARELAYAAWLAAEVQEAIDDDGPTLSTEEAMRQVHAAVFGE